MKNSEKVIKRLKELTNEELPPHHGDSVEEFEWHVWATSALNILEFAFGKGSTHHRELKKIVDRFSGYVVSVLNANAVLLAALNDIDAGVVGSLEKRLSGEIFADFLTLAKNALGEGQKDVAAVLASAALEDTLKKFALLNGLDVEGKTLDNVIGALKGAGHFSGAAKGIVGAMPKIRNHAMHAEWDQIKDHDVASLIGFTEQFLLTNMS